MSSRPNKAERSASAVRKGVGFRKNTCTNQREFGRKGERGGKKGMVGKVSSFGIGRLPGEARGEKEWGPRGIQTCRNLGKSSVCGSGLVKQMEGIRQPVGGKGRGKRRERTERFSHTKGGWRLCNKSIPGSGWFFEKELSCNRNGGEPAALKKRGRNFERRRKGGGGPKGGFTRGKKKKNNSLTPTRGE